MNCFMKSRFMFVMFSVISGVVSRVSGCVGVVWCVVGCMVGRLSVCYSSVSKVIGVRYRKVLC